MGIDIPAVSDYQLRCVNECCSRFSLVSIFSLSLWNVYSLFVSRLSCLLSPASAGMFISGFYCLTS